MYTHSSVLYVVPFLFELCLELFFANNDLLLYIYIYKLNSPVFPTYSISHLHQWLTRGVKYVSFFYLHNYIVTDNSIE